MLSGPTALIIIDQGARRLTQTMKTQDKCVVDGGAVLTKL